MTFHRWAFIAFVFFFAQAGRDARAGSLTSSNLVAGPLITLGQLPLLPPTDGPVTPDFIRGACWAARIASQPMPTGASIMIGDKITCPEPKQ